MLIATTRIWPIKTNLKNSINYIINPEKTTNEDFGTVRYLELDPRKEYNLKYEKSVYVSTLNCNEIDPYKDMELTKSIYHKEDGILGFHSYQSFKEDEVSADLAHEIGIKFAQEMWPNYQVVIATHQNTNHIHNHFIINSVSFEDGRKYNNSRYNLSRFRYISDSLCRDYGLSYLDKNNAFDKSFAKYTRNNPYYQIAREDLDNAINESLTQEQLLKRLKTMNYKCELRYGYLNMWKDGNEKIRVDRVFGNNYTPENIRKRFEKSSYKRFNYFKERDIFNLFLKTNKPHKGIYGLYLYYCYLLDKFPKQYSKQYLPYSIRKEVAILDTYSKETIFMSDHKLTTYDDLLAFKEENNSKLEQLRASKENAWKRYHRAKTDEKKNAELKIINELAEEIKELATNKKYIDDIESRSKVIEYNINNFDEELNNDRQKNIGLAKC